LWIPVQMKLYQKKQVNEYHERLSFEQITNSLPDFTSMFLNSNRSFNVLHVLWLKNDNIVWLYVLLLSGSSFNGHPLFNEHIVKSLKLGPFSYCKVDLYQVVISIQQTQSAFRISNWLILLYFTYIKWTCNQLQCGILSLQYKKHVHFLLTAGRT